MRLTPLAAMAAACVLTLTACGDDGDDPKASDGTEAPSATDAPTEQPTEFPTEIPTDQPKGPPGTGKKVCNALDAAEVGEILGGTVERSPVSATGCSFSGTGGDAQRAVTITSVEVAAVGGVDAFRTSMEAVAGGELEEVPDAGDQAFVGVADGPTGAIANGAVVVGESLFQLLVLPGEGASADDAKAAAVELMGLVGAAA